MMREIILDDLPGEEEFAEVERWFVEEGAQVFTGDVIADLVVKGKSLRINAPCSGLLSEIFFESGDEIEVGEVLALIEDESEEILETVDEEKISF
ncbi:biotin/lipoyl-containing protein [Chlamydiota bacterium]